ncbi:MOSC domain-containing protein [Ottowia sp.]|uniref:MOSC domain-containing protein n=1 Tax=Ottowia sp. TaxID=1898956 RepID=UPI002BCDC1B7|nr:MOSC domain-containing protein [Ottowia sp.]HOB66983.1 MOSC domain-containing protein [Ottowia sp.]HPZ58095.1 MOSC domain-containing protein [Ottowia sp.]HQD47731.1 MOSC domain-containing protein [Ottowia sp.]
MVLNESPPRIRSVNRALAAPLRLPGGRSVLSGIGKRPVAGPVAVGKLGLQGDEQADLNVHGGLHKAVYAYPAEHYAAWHAQRRAHGVSLFDEALPPGFLGENLTIEGLLETEVWVGDTLRFDGSACVLRVTAPREPCGKFIAVMGYAEAARQMVREARCGWYLAVDEPGELAPGMAMTLQPGRRALSILDAIRAKWARHRH